MPSVSTLLAPGDTNRLLPIYHSIGTFHKEIDDETNATIFFSVPFCRLEEEDVIS